MANNLKFAVLIHLGDYREASSIMKRDIAAAAQDIGFSGTIDDEANNAKWIAFNRGEQADAMVREARRIGFTTAGRLSSPIYIPREAYNR